jgi:hypothetical protein
MALGAALSKPSLIPQPYSSAEDLSRELMFPITSSATSVLTQTPIASILPQESALAPNRSTTGPSNIAYLFQSTSSSKRAPSMIARSIEGLHLDAETIIDLFEMSVRSPYTHISLTNTSYFRHYSPLLPILDSKVHANEYYTQSPLLFWSIAAVASRRYKKDPTIMTVLPIKALDLAMRTIFSATAGVSAVESMLLLLSWPPVPNPTYDEIPYVSSSALLHVAMRIGLQIPHASQDFARVKLSLSGTECNRRFRLWTHCIMIYERYMLLTIAKK